jgi:chromosome segregation ATPase
MLKSNITFQTQCKEATLSKNKLLLLEKDKTDMLEIECRESISSVMQKIAEDQVDIDRKIAENEDLRLKLERFEHNLALLRDRAENEKKVSDLTQKLNEAKKAQYDYNQEQQRLKENSVKAKLRHQEEVIHQLKKQIKFFDAKFVEFESTIAQSRTVLGKFEEKKSELEMQLEKLREDNAGLVNKSRQEDVKLISAMQRSSELRLEVSAVKCEYDKTEKTCRQLQTTRKQALSKSADANPPPPRDNSSSTSSSSSAAATAYSTAYSANATANANANATAIGSGSGIASLPLPPPPSTAHSSLLPTEVGVGSPVSSPSAHLLKKSPPQ